MVNKNLTQIEKELRRLPIDKLRLLKLFAGIENYISSDYIASKLSIEDVKLGGVISSLIRTRILKVPLILSVGKDRRRAVLTLNEELISKGNLQKVLKKIGL